MNYKKIKPKLVSFKLCPFVQRSIIALNEKNIEYDITYIDLSDPPEWFLELSPLGQVPIMQIEDTVIFESSVINEYLDEVYKPQLHPSDPLRKAHNRAWMEFSSVLYTYIFNFSTIINKKRFQNSIEELEEKIDLLEMQLNEDSKFINGNDLSLVDISFAPFFMRANLLSKQFGIDFFENNSKIKLYSENLLTRNSVIKSVVPEFNDIFLKFVENRKGYITKLS